MNTIAKQIAACAVILSTSAVWAADDGLVVLDWSAYDDENFFLGYIEKHGDMPVFSMFGEEEEAFQKLRAGFKADLTHPCSQSVPKWREAGVIEPFDPSRIERWDDLNEIMREAFKYEDGYYLVPADWGTTTLTYRADLVEEAEMESLQVFLDPKYAGRTSIGDNVDDAYALAYLATGLDDWTKATDDDFRKASDWLRKAHQNVRAYWVDGAELAQLMGSGEVLFSWAWNETAVTMSADGFDVVSNREPVEGSSDWFCGYANVTNQANDEAKAYDFINAWMEPRSAKYLVNDWGYGHGNSAAMAELGEDVINAGLGEIDAPVLSQVPMDHALRENMIAEFEMIKAGF
ncbi:MAG: extracellular solute-binding protein [Albidovulum sp.]|nr:extracellular solute-binding protein [Albidovulum sp.]MDE0532111.1 extracellular solute-binding protein [Albidovulum sp.]